MRFDLAEKRKRRQRDFVDFRKKSSLRDTEESGERKDPLFPRTRWEKGFPRVASGRNPSMEIQSFLGRDRITVEDPDKLVNRFRPCEKGTFCPVDGRKPAATLCQQLLTVDTENLQDRFVPEFVGRRKQNSWRKEEIYRINRAIFANASC